MRPGREARLTSLIKRLAAAFLGREMAAPDRPPGGWTGVLAVSRVKLGNKGRRAEIYVTVFPDAAEAEGLKEARRLRRPLQQFLRKQLTLKHTPYLEVLIDKEEKRHRESVAAR